MAQPMLSWLRSSLMRIDSPKAGALVAAVPAILTLACGGQSDHGPCAGALSVAALGSRAAVLKADGSVWSWGDGDGTPHRTDPNGMFVGGFVDHTLCVRDDAGDISCPFRAESAGETVPVHADAVAIWIDAIRPDELLRADSTPHPVASCE
jgi:alpha-tubulin suppressor-like RCC1 family protein